MAQFELTETAETHLGDILAYFAERYETVAMDLRREFYEAFQRLAEMPALGHPRPDLTSQPYQFWTVGRYHVIYDPARVPLTIVAVYHQSRDVKTLLR
jgi:plasmid stabilization system protein ParE